MTYYRSRLARIHATDYAHHARAAARLLIDELGDDQGLVLDLGCGAGDLCGTIRSAGFDYLGVDLSPDMLALARSRYPGERFEQRSAFDLPEITGVVAIAAVGEVVNYAMDPRAGTTGLTRWLRDCRERLAPGGLLLMDVAGPMRADPEPSMRIVNGDDYRLEITVMTDPARRLLRRSMTIEDSMGTETEVHELHLVDPLEVMAALHACGFVTTPLAQYDPELPLPRGWSIFLARVILDA